MFSHIAIGTNDMARKKVFYDALVAATGGEPGIEDAKGLLIYAHRSGRLLVTKPIDGKTVTERTAAPSGSRWKALRRPRHGTMPVWRPAESRS